MIERLGWVLLASIIVWLISRWLRLYQTRSLRTSAQEAASHGQASLIVVVSPRCAICPAQKNVVLRLRERYPPSLLRVVTIDSELQPDQARQLAVMTVPTTLLQGPDGTIAHINNGYTQLDVLASQIENLLARNPGG